MCAKFSALYDWWNEQFASDGALVTVLKQRVRANVLAMHAILTVRPDALFIQSESAERFHAAEPQAMAETAMMNERRCLSLDLNYGRQIGADMLRYVLDNGMSMDEYDFFMHRSLKQHCTRGTDYYLTNEHHVRTDGCLSGAGDVFGYAVIGRQYYERYRLPMMHTETNGRGAAPRIDEPDWLHRQWLSARNLHSCGVPVLGFTRYSLTDRIDSDIALRHKPATLTPYGLFDLDRNIRPVGEAYRQMIARWRGVLPSQSMCLELPVALPEASA
ncbi:MAG: hypothetical protein V4724_38160 [Pseudomonadota bacterium]